MCIISITKGGRGWIWTIFWDGGGYFTTLIWVTACVQTEIWCINCYFSLVFLADSILLKVFSVVLYFLNGLFKKKSVKRTVVHMLVLRPLLFCSIGGRTRALSTKCKIDQVDFIDWISFQPSNLMEEISSNPEILRTNT